ncbi:Tad domain-containing protein [Vibrio natriegens]|uniref:Tad domain-containing protein n=1 Tax=Vibrio natriegens TaxID=691 RepID=UPI00390B719A
MSYVKPIATRRSQSGITLVLISLIMLILIGMGAFAMDLNHQVLNKARLQNAVDSAALASAIVADDTDDLNLAEAAAIEALKSFAESFGNQELAAKAEEGMAGTISITFSNTKEKGSFYKASFLFPDGSSPLDSEEDIYVRVEVSGVSLTQFLSRIFGGGKSVSASAVAGLSSEIIESCNLAPMAVCGDKNKDSPSEVWGYNSSTYDPSLTKSPDMIHALKVGDQNNTAMGPGNFQLIDFKQGTFSDEDVKNGNDGGGAALVRQAMAGGYDGCAIVGKEVTTKPGNSIGPVAQGINTRLNYFTGPIQKGGDVKPDEYVEEAKINTEEVDGKLKVVSSDFYYADYLDCVQNGAGCETKSLMNELESEPGRRILRIPIVDCTADSTGKTEFDVLGFGCFFLMKKVANNASEDANVFGQFLYGCPINNGSTGIESSTSGQYRIQLYKDPYSGAS